MRTNRGMTVKLYELNMEKKSRASRFSEASQVTSKPKPVNPTRAMTNPTEIGDWVSELKLHRYIIMGIIIFIYLAMGCLMDSLAMIMLTIPIFYPVVTTLGFDPIWFGVIIVVVTEMGVITPPVGINVYVVAGVARDIPLHIIFKGAMHLLMAQLATALLLILFPQIALFLPSLMK